jgi:glycosyltransferase involved in cell wall biosynthesis
MRVGVYLVGLDPAYSGGMKTYAVGLINGLIRGSRACDVVVFVNDEARSEVESRIDRNDVNFVSVSIQRGRVAERVSWLLGVEALHVAVRNRRTRRVADLIGRHCDVVLFPLSYLGAYRLPVPSIVSFHDLQHEKFPGFFTWRELRARRMLFGATFRYASLIQASSEAMKAEALRIYGDRLGAERIAVIPEGVDFAAFAAEPGVDPRKEYALPPEFLFYPAQIWHHKNHLRLLEALYLLRSRAGTRIPLVLTGAEYEAAPAVRRFIADRGLGDQVFLLGVVPYATLRGLYRQAAYILSASLHESSCLPVLEAAASGSPLLVADIPANRESARVFKLRLFDPLDVENIAAVLSEAWAGRRANDAISEENRDAARRFDWTAIANMYLEKAEQLLMSSQVARNARGGIRPPATSPAAGNVK